MDQDRTPVTGAIPTQSPTPRPTPTDTPAPQRPISTFERRDVKNTISRFRRS